MIRISQLKTIDKKGLEQINVLLPQLSSHAQPFSLHELKRVLEQKHLVYLIAREKGNIVGMGLLWIFRKSIGLQGIIEDMAVSETYQGKGIGKEIAKKLIDIGKRKKLTHIDLTSRPERVAANELYKKLGFQRRDTNVYRLYLAK